MTKSKPKICIVTATLLTIQFFFKPHIIELSKNFDVTLAYNPENDAYLPQLDLPVKYMEIGIMRKISPLRDLVTLFQLYKQFRQERFDLVLSLVPKAGLLGMIAALAACVPYRLHIFQGEVWFARHMAMRLLLKTMDHVTAKAATHLLAVSKGESEFLKMQGIAEKNKIQVLGAGSISGVDLNRFHPNSEARNAIRKTHNIPDDAVICIFVGRLNADKGVLELVRAFKICAEKNDKLWLFIIGPDEEGMAEQLRLLLPAKLSARMIIQGYTNEPELYLAASDFLCLPSYREAFGMVIIEAAAVGVPSIGSRIYGITDAIKEDETGLLAQAKNIKELVSAIDLLAKDKGLRTSLSLAGRDRVKNDFEQSKVVANYVGYISKLLSH